MEALDPYTSVLGLSCLALLLVTAGMAKKRLVWKPQRMPISVWRRRRRS